MTSDFISMFDEFNDATFNVFMAVVCSLGDIANIVTERSPNHQE